ncbi:MAG: hypothetical protein LBT33_03225 [Spirochaetia bacterium]|jgi:hypothetical protein|nr:hypothetical protein [Spirochaetia bacterium]
MKTVVLTDGLGRGILTAKQGETRGAGNQRQYGWNISGALRYDAKGWAVAEGQNEFVPGRM